MIDDLDEEQYMRREAFAHYGSAMYYAQCVERSIGILLTLEQAQHRQITGFQLNYELEENFLKTFGRLVRSLQDINVTLEPETERKLERALKERNRLAHDYWWEKAIAISRKDGVLKIIRELNEISELFEELDEFFAKVYEQHRERLGIPDEAVDEVLNGYQAGQLIEFPKERMLNKTERIVKVLRYYFDSKRQNFIPIFVFDDNSVWTLGDSGFTQTFDSLDNERCVTDKQSNVMCPCEVNTKPIKRGNWNYTLRLSNGYNIIVQEGDKTRGTTFSFSFKKGSHP